MNATINNDSTSKNDTSTQSQEGEKTNSDANIKCTTGNCPCKYECYCDPKDVDEEAFSHLTNLKEFVTSLTSNEKAKHEKPDKKDIKDFLKILNTSMRNHGITECIVKAHLIAHMYVESAYFKKTLEDQYPFDENGKILKRKKGETKEQWKERRKQQTAYMDWPPYHGDQIADYNVFHGRGYIQLTHSKNYAKYLKIDDIAETVEPENDVEDKIEEIRKTVDKSVDVTCWFWENYPFRPKPKNPEILTLLARKNDIKGTTRGITGGTDPKATSYNERQDALGLIGEGLHIECCKKYSGVWNAWHAKWRSTYDKKKAAEKEKQAKREAAKAKREAAKAKRKAAKAKHTKPGK